MAKYRSITGEGNNLNHKLTTFDNKSNKIGDVGAAETRLSRLIDPAYENGIDEPRGGDPSFLPSTRQISNTIVNYRSPLYWIEKLIYHKYDYNQN